MDERRTEAECEANEDDANLYILLPRELFARVETNCEIEGKVLIRHARTDLSPAV